MHKYKSINIKDSINFGEFLHYVLEILFLNYLLIILYINKCNYQISIYFVLN
jgi:hypothetical protein